MKKLAWLTIACLCTIGATTGAIVGNTLTRIAALEDIAELHNKTFQLRGETEQLRRKTEQLRMARPAVEDRFFVIAVNVGEDLDDLQLCMEWAWAMCEHDGEVVCGMDVTADCSFTCCPKDGPE